MRASRGRPAEQREPEQNRAFQRRPDSRALTEVGSREVRRAAARADIYWGLSAEGWTTSIGTASEKISIFSSDGASYDVRSLKIKLARVRNFPKKSRRQERFPRASAFKN